MTRRTGLSRISRRALIGSGAVASAFAVSGVPAGATPRRGGALRIATPDSEIFDRLIAPGAAFDCLTEIAGDGALRGELAENWSADAGGLGWKFTLRADARFHDGRPVEAADAAAVLRARIAEGHPALAHVSRVLCGADGRQIAVRLTEPDPQFPLKLADPALVIRPRDGRTGAGSGLYRVVEEGPGRRVRLTRVDGHPRDARGGWFDRLEIIGLDDPEVVGAS